GRRNSFNVQKVLWLIGELGLAHEHIPAGGDFGRLNELTFRALNPHGRVPVIEDGDLAVWESHAILRYLAARYDRSRLWSADPAERARVDADAPARFPDGRLLGLLSHAGIAARLACDPQESGALRRSFSAPGRRSGGAAVPGRRELLVGGHPRRHVALSLFRARYRTSRRCERERLVCAPAPAAGLPRARHDPVCGLARPARTLRVGPQRRTCNRSRIASPPTWDGRGRRLARWAGASSQLGPIRPSCFRLCCQITPRAQ